MQVRLVKGFITRERWMLGKTPREMARLLGFSESRIAQGAKIYALSILPRNEQFAFAGHTHWSGGKPVGGEPELWPANQVKIDERFMRSPEIRAKDNVRSTWTLTSPERLIKIETVIPHQEDVSPQTQYPPGAGVEQWVLLDPLPPGSCQNWDRMNVTARRVDTFDLDWASRANVAVVGWLDRDSVF